MQTTRVTIASLESCLSNLEKNMKLTVQACKQAYKENARIILLPELMLTGHGAHNKMSKNAQSIPNGEIAQKIISLSEKYNLCICVGMAELDNDIVYNTQLVVDRGKYIGKQRKIYLSGDEYCHFASGNTVETFSIDNFKFGISICYDNNFPEIALIHKLHNVDAIFSPHACRSGEWPDELTEKFCISKIHEIQKMWQDTHITRAKDHNVFVLLCNAVGSATKGLWGVCANHAGTVMAIDPYGEIFLKTAKTYISNEIKTVTLYANRKKFNHAPTRNRRISTIYKLLDDCKL